MYSFFIKWRYVGVFLCAMIYSEPAIILISFLSAAVKLNLFILFFFAFFGTFISSTMFFCLGRLFRKKLQSFSFFHYYIEKVNSLMRVYSHYFIISFRFMYGVKLISPIVLGFSNLTFKFFLINNLIGSGIWSICMVLIGKCLSVFFKEFNFYLLFYTYVFLTVTPLLIIMLFSYLKKRFSK